MIRKIFITRVLFLLVVSNSATINADYANGLLAYRFSNFEVAYEEFLSEAVKGHTQAQYYLGEMYESGVGPDKNIKTALEWYEKAAANDHGRSGACIASIYQRGLGVKRDNKKVFKWYQLAANNNDLIAQYELGELYANGVGVKVDLVKSFKWLSIATAYGEPDAAVSLEALIKNMSKKEVSKGEELVVAWEQKREEEKILKRAW